MFMGEKPTVRLCPPAPQFWGDLKAPKVGGLGAKTRTGNILLRQCINPIAAFVGWALPTTR